MSDLRQKRFRLRNQPEHMTQKMLVVDVLQNLLRHVKKLNKTLVDQKALVVLIYHKNSVNRGIHLRLKKRRLCFQLRFVSLALADIAEGPYAAVIFSCRTLHRRRIELNDAPIDQVELEEAQGSCRVGVKALDSARTASGSFIFESMCS